MIILKSDREIEIMKQAGKISAMALDAVRRAVRPGVSTYELDMIAYDVILSNNATPAFLNYNGYPNSICASVNDEIVHGIPSESRILNEGDIISIDVGAVWGGYVGDNADTVGVGKISDEAQALIDVTRNSFFAGLEFCKETYRLGDVSHAIGEYAESRGYGVVKDYVGHGIGTEMHQEPSVPNYGKAGRGVRLAKGLTIAIEPMINIGTYKTKVMPDGWTVKTADGSLSAHYENTIAITDGEPLILTLL
ncbi:MAG: type I methionyl aminopeptidase [Anaerofustis stercorihominis]|nr:type I methionyl aminopeptidase [Anaerofustis stercorihominis]